MARAVDSDSTGHRFDSCLPCQSLGPETHEWIGAGRHETHVKGGVPDLFKYGLRPVWFVQCRKCGQNGFRRSPWAKLVYTWAQEDVNG